ncbi:ABC transporter [Ochromonadaceae sp. CCMP2298]|nr:ABC transporter [Ochromonadaceae sp. CCMP2298]
MSTMLKVVVLVLMLVHVQLALALRLPCCSVMRAPIRSGSALRSTSSSAVPVTNKSKSADSGAAMQITDVNLSIGNNDIISKINWTIMPRERWALVGKNGAGKSTLLKALTGTGGDHVTVRDGSIAVAKRSRVGYLEQKGVSGSTRTVRDEVVSRMDRLQAAVKSLEEAEARVIGGDTSDEALEKLESASSEFDLAGGYTVEVKISNVLKGLGFVESDYDRLCAEFSGGWQMRIALARLLLSEPDLLFLDEPSNHLDKGAKDWLGGYLAQYDGTLLIVSHDEALLDTAANSIAEVRGGKIELYKSRTHQQWIVEREERVRLAQAAYESNQLEIERLQGFVDRFGAKTMGASMAQSRLKTIEKLTKNGPQAPMISDGPAPVLKLPTPPRGSKTLLSLKGASLAWPAAKGGPTVVDGAEVAQQQPFIIQGASIEIERGMRIAVRGPNGAGKSTLLSALSGKLLPAVGIREEGDGLALGTFTQDLAQDLDQSARAVDVVTSAVRQFDTSLTDERARSVLGALGLVGEKAIRVVGDLSGGEKARVALASFVLIPHNLLLLDEPSNHLDVGTINTLTTALREFPGSCLVISHDRTFLEALQPTHVLTVRDGGVTMEARGLREEDWNDPLNSRCEVVESKFAAIPTPAVSFSTGKAAPATPIDDEAHRKKVLNAPRRMKKIENLLEKHDSDLKKIDQKMLDNGTKSGILNDLQKDKNEFQAKVDKLYAEYEELEQYVQAA